MTALQIAKSRTSARSEAVVSFRGGVANPDWPGLAVTVAGDDANGGTSGYVGSPTYYFQHFNARSGGADTFGVPGDIVTDFVSYSPSFIEQCSVRILRPVNGVIQEIRNAPIASAAVDYWESRKTASNQVRPITGTSFEFALASWENLTNTYTLGVAVIDPATGLIGPVATTTVSVVGPTYTVLAVTPPSTLASERLPVGRNGSLPAVTGLTAQVRVGSTHNIQMSWSSAGGGLAYVVLINWDGTSDRLPTECALTLEAGGAPILTNDMVILTSALVLDEDAARASNRTKGIVNIRRITNPSGAEPSGTSAFVYVPHGGGTTKPQITYPNHFL